VFEQLSNAIVGRDILAQKHVVTAGFGHSCQKTRC